MTAVTRSSGRRSARPTLRVLLVAAEIYPWVKTGGLGDVLGALPPALARGGADVRLLLPGLPALLQAVKRKRSVRSLGPAFGADHIDVLRGTLALGSGHTVYLVHAPQLFARPGNPYLGPDGRDWPDNHLRFGLLGWVGAQLAQGEIDPRWRADVMHGHDWHAGLGPVYLRGGPGAGAVRSLFTIHNLAFQGLFDPAVLEQLQLPRSFFTPDGLEFYGRLSFMKAGLRYADRISTVSPNYAQEIQTPEFGCGLEGLLRARSGALVGILNGVDDAVWNPSTDPLLADHYSVDDLAGKARLKAALQRDLGLVERPDAVVFGVVSRITEQKGLDLLAQALPTLRQLGGQLALLGEGDAAIERTLRAASAANSDAISVRLGYDEAHAHQIIAGADVIVVPSRFEPCGLTQLYGLRYGTLPLVRRVGGLADTVVDATASTIDADTATGFVFDEPTVTALAGALRRVGEAWRNRERWKRLMRCAMAQDYSWDRAAAAYVRLYGELQAQGEGPSPH